MIRPLVLAVVLALGGCNDGPYEDVADCCYLWPQQDEERSCVRENTPPGKCIELRCTLGEAFTVCRDLFDAGVRVDAGVADVADAAVDTW